jgi:hypothetical protein
VVASYAKKRENPTLADIGFVQQAELFDQVAGWTGEPPVVIDSADIRIDPRGALTRLCAALGIPFTDSMLHWPAGPKAFDGVWAPHWYNAVWTSTGFADPPAESPALPSALQHIADEARLYYERLKAHRL